MTVMDLDPEVVARLRSALGQPLPEIPARFLYDDRGSALFEKITELPEYYQTRTEIGILSERADAIVAAAGQPRRLAELGSGAGRKIGLLIEAGRRAGTLDELMLLDINASFLDQSAHTLRARYPGLRVTTLPGDFTRDLPELGPGGSRMIAFFGGTLGNLAPEAVPGFFGALAAQMAEGDVVLVGVDLVKDPARLEAAYNDTAGVTAAFNRNILRGFNGVTGATFDPEAFDHRAFYDPDHAWIEMRLRARRAMAVEVPALDLTVELSTGDELRTEISCKYTRQSLAERVAPAGLSLTGWFVDPDELFALALLA